ncbi:TRAP transporter large permease subunit, partial [Achromobacter xylosoxidans]|uniref:TRAP transporter large permease subunit n=1 Tax=Alcaligenes xylosoxydans xylosoxydans TaxID=85698 RepID=UPI003D0775C0
MALTLLSFTFMGFLVIGVPVAFAIGLSSITAIMYEDLPLAVAFQQMTSGMNAFSFLAIPFFIFTGELMLYGGIQRPQEHDAALRAGAAHRFAAQGDTATT